MTINKITYFAVRDGARLVIASFIGWMAIATCDIAIAQITTPGTMLGESGVSAGGAATYRIPLQVPSGIAGMEPQLALVYNSQARDGLMGLGWSLEGLSVISRCPRTLAQDGVRGAVLYDMNDRFCMGGQRLMVVSGSYGEAGAEYKLEQEDFSKITSSSGAAMGPGSFVVQTKSGLKMEYGTTVDSRIEVAGTSVVRVWALNRITDVKGNSIAIVYTENNALGEYYPSRIEYANTAVELIFEQRPDVSVAYEAGYATRQTVRLIEVRARMAGSVVGRYLINYLSNYSAANKTVINEIKRCTGADVCLAPSKFKWNATSNGFQENANISVGGWHYPSVNTGMRDFAMDVNGDGRTDLVRLWPNGSQAYAQVWLSNGGGFVEASNATIGSWYAPENGVGVKDIPMDVDGDGRTDIVRIWNNNGAAWANVWLSNGTGFMEKGNAAVGGWNYPSVSTGMRDFAMDVNGDGRTDLVRLWPNGTQAYAEVWLSNGSGFLAESNSSIGSWYAPENADGIKDIPMDVDGDGRVDIVRIWNNNWAAWANVWLSNGSGFTDKGNTVVGGWNYPSVNTGMRDFAMDVNGDGRADLVRIWPNGTQAYAEVWLSNGSGFVGASNATIGSWYAPEDGLGIKDIPMDVNGDGRTDIVRIWNNNGAAWANVWLSNGAGFADKGNSVVGTWYYSVDGAGIKDLVVDINGDGRADLLRLWNNGGTAMASVQRSNFIPQVRIEEFERSPGDVSKVTYSTLSSGENYTQSMYVYPYVGIRNAMQVVAKRESVNGLGGFNATTYAYGGLRAEQRTGRGVQGFTWMKSLNVPLNIEDYSEFHQSWPFTGLVSKTERKLLGVPSAEAGYTRLRIGTYSYSCRLPEGNACTNSPGNRYFVMQNSSVVNDFDITGQSTAFSRKSVQYGQWGDVTLVVSLDFNGTPIQTIANEYWPADTSSGKWILGRLKKSTTTTVTP